MYCVGMAGQQSTQKSIQPKSDNNPSLFIWFPLNTCKGDSWGFSRNSHEQCTDTKIWCLKTTEGLWSNIPTGPSSLTPGWIQQWHDQLLVLQWCRSVRFHIPSMICAFDRRVTSLQGSDTISGTDKGMKTIWLRYQIASHENRTLVFASSPGSFWHFAICKHYQRAFHTCLGTEVRASSWQVESNTLCHKDFQSKSLQLCYIKSTLHP